MRFSMSKKIIFWFWPIVGLFSYISIIWTAGLKTCPFSIALQMSAISVSTSSNTGRSLPSSDFKIIASSEFYSPVPSGKISHNVLVLSILSVLRAPRCPFQGALGKQLKSVGIFFVESGFLCSGFKSSSILKSCSSGTFSISSSDVINFLPLGRPRFFGSMF